MPIVPPHEHWLNGHWLWGLFSVKRSTCMYSNYFELRNIFAIFLDAAMQCRNWAGKASHQTAPMDISTNQLGVCWRSVPVTERGNWRFWGLKAVSQLENSATELCDWVSFWSLKIFWCASLFILFRNLL